MTGEARWYKPKLIEVALPLEAINKASASRSTTWEILLSTRATLRRDGSSWRRASPSLESSETSAASPGRSTTWGRWP